MNDLNEWEKLVILEFLKDFRDRLGCDGCNDTKQEIIDLIPKDQFSVIDKIFFDLIANPDNYDSNNSIVPYNNYYLILYMIERLKGNIK